jgi:TolA-binding protein
MTKPVRIIAVVAGAIALAVILALFALRDKRPRRSPPREATPVVEATPSEPAPVAVKPIPPSSAPLVTGPKLGKPAGPEGGKRLDEASLLAKLHDLAASDPPLSLRLAREAVALFPDSPNAPEFAWNVAKALFNMGRMKEAEDEARVMVKKYPGNYFAGDVEHHLLNHPPNPK